MRGVGEGEVEEEEERACGKTAGPIYSGERG